MDLSSWSNDDVTVLVPSDWASVNMQYVDVTLTLQAPSSITSLSLYDGQGSFDAAPDTIYALNGTQKTLLGTFSGDLYNQWVNINLAQPVNATAIIVHKYGNNIPQKIFIYGTAISSQPTTPPDTTVVVSNPVVPVVPGVLKSYGSSTSTGSAPATPIITDTTIIKIPIDGNRWYQLDNVSNGLQGLFDGDTITNINTGYGKLLTNFDAYYPVAADEAINVYAVKFFDGSGTLGSTPMTLYAIDDQGTKTLLGTFTGAQYNQWVGPNNTAGQFNLTTPVKNVRYLVLNSSSMYPTEMQIYGMYKAGAAPTPATPTPVKLSQMFGVNGFEWNFLNPNAPNTIVPAEMTAGKTFTQIRHYLDWGRIEPTQGNYTFSPSHNGGWDYDVLYQSLKAQGIEVLADIKTLPQWMINTYPADQQDNENVPAPYGSDLTDPNSYIAQAKVAFQFAARYGYNTSVNPALQSVDASQRWSGDQINTVKTGMGLIKYIECDNERDKWWKGIKAYQTAFEYTANLSAFYDGNKNTMGPGVGVKNADPNMQVVMCGIALASPDYIKGMVDWCKMHRGYKADGTVNLCWDVINYHLYSNNTGTSQGGNPTAGAAPEGSGAASTAQDFINAAHQYAQDMPVWVTELGYDINQGSPLHAFPIGAKSAAQTQADWSLRSSLLYARAGVQRVFFYEMYDDNPTSTVQFASSGLLNADYSRRPVADYLYQTNKLLGAYTYSSTINSSPFVDKYTLNGNSAYVLAMPTQNGSTANYTLDLGSADSARIYTPTIGQDSMSVQKVKTTNGKLSLTVTETPMFVIPFNAAVACFIPTAGNGGPVCEGTTLTLTSTTTTGATFSWTGPNGFTSTLQNPTIPSVIAADSGLYTVSLMAAGCTSSSSVNAVVNRKPVLIINNPVAICAPASVNITLASVTAGSTIPSGTTLNYYTDAAGTIVLANPTAITTSGTYYIKAITLTGCSDIKPVTVTINPQPVLTISTPVAACAPATINITTAPVTAGSTIPSGTTLNYYTDAAGTTILTNPGAITTSGTYYIKATTLTGCSDIKPVTVTVNLQPIFTAASTTCAVNTLSYSIAVSVSTGTLTSNVGTVANPSPNNWTISGIPTGTNANLLLTNGGGCTNSLAVNAPTCACPIVAAPTSGGDQIQCAQTPVQTLTATATVPAGYSVRWFSAASGGTAVSNPVLNSIGTVTYYAEAYNPASPVCASIRTAVTLTINPQPALTISNPAAICAPATIDITAAAIIAGSTIPSGTTLNYYTDAAGTIALATPTAITTSGTYYIKAIVPAGCSDIKPVTLTINPLPIFTSTAATTCAANTLSYSIAISVNGGTLTSNVGTVANPSSNNWTITGITSGTNANLLLTNAGGCTNTLTVNAPTCACPIVAAPISGGDQIQCAQMPLQTLTATVTVPSGYAVRWFSAATGGSSISNPVLNSVGTITYYAEAYDPSSPVCSSSRTAVTLTINPQPVLTINNPAATCAPATIDITTAAVTAGSSIPSGTILNYYTDAAGSNVLTNPTAITANGIYYIKAQSTSGCSVVQPVTATINLQPTISVSSTNPTTCNGNNGTFTVSGLTASSTYVINFNKGGVAQPSQAIIASSTGSITITSLTRGTYSNIIATNNTGCSSTNTGNAILSDPGAPVVNASVNASACEGSTLSLNVNATAGATYSWTGPNSYISNQQNPALLNATSNNSGTYTVTVVANGCQNNGSVSVTVNPHPSLSITSPAAVCAPATVDLTNAAITSGSSLSGSSLSYFADAALTTPLTNPAAIATAGTYYIEASNGSGCTDVKPVTVTFAPSPAAPISGGDQIVCAQTPVQLLTAMASPTATTVWYSSPTGTATVNPVLNSVGSVTYYGESNVSGCKSAGRTAVKLTIVAPPQISFSQTNVSVNAGTSVDLTANVSTATPGDVPTYSWMTDYNISSLSSLNTVVSPDVDTTYIFKAASGILPACSATASVHVTILQPVLSARALSVPNAFSPNGDGVHDTWYIQALEEYSNACVMVFDRAGTMVFRSNGNYLEAPWNGTYNGQPLPIGAYYYIIKLNSGTTAGANQLTGYVSIIR